MMGELHAAGRFPQTSTPVDRDWERRKEADRRDNARSYAAARLGVNPNDLASYALAAGLVAEEIALGGYRSAAERLEALSRCRGVWASYGFDEKNILRLADPTGPFLALLDEDNELWQALNVLGVSNVRWAYARHRVECRRSRALANIRVERACSEAAMAKGLRRKRPGRRPRAARSHRSRRASSTRSSAASGDGPSDDPDSSEPAFGRLLVGGAK